MLKWQVGYHWDCTPFDRHSCNVQRTNILHWTMNACGITFAELSLHYLCCCTRFWGTPALLLPNPLPYQQGMGRVSLSVPHPPPHFKDCTAFSPCYFFFRANFFCPQFSTMWMQSIGGGLHLHFVSCFQLLSVAFSCFQSWAYLALSRALAKKSWCIHLDAGPGGGGGGGALVYSWSTRGPCPCYGPSIKMSG